ncbi:MAG: hypothetical protein KatS3mg040_0460 [Candidatus Kapaibacterium sp.]|nr:MAG: hypothetical protein KatS3mg040_0460 [Candidatus Kapabacteria bacterium]
MPKRVVVVGGGFGGLQVVRSLRNTLFAVTLLSRRNQAQWTARVAFVGRCPYRVLDPFSQSHCCHDRVAVVLPHVSTARTAADRV